MTVKSGVRTLTAVDVAKPRQPQNPKLVFGKFALLGAVAVTSAVACSSIVAPEDKKTADSGQTDGVSLSGDATATNATDSISGMDMSNGKDSKTGGASCDAVTTKKTFLQIKNDDGKDSKYEIVDGKVTIGTTVWAVNTDSDGNVTSLETNGKKYDVKNNILMVTENGETVIYMNASAQVGFSVTGTSSTEVISNVGFYMVTALGTPNGASSVDLLSKGNSLTSDDGKVTAKITSVNNNTVYVDVTMDGVNRNGTTMNGTISVEVAQGGTVTLPGGYTLTIAGKSMVKPEGCATESASLTVTYDGNTVQTQVSKGMMFVLDKNGGLLIVEKVVPDVVKLTVTATTTNGTVILSNNGVGNNVGVKNQVNLTVNGKPLQIVLTGTNETLVSTDADAQ